MLLQQEIEQEAARSFNLAEGRKPDMCQVVGRSRGSLHPRHATFRFRKGMVVTVEPGLYYRGLGGARIEDVVHLVPGGNEMISAAPYKWQIP